MRIFDLTSVPEGGVLDADLVIVGSGPVGLTVAHEFSNSGLKVLVLESGQFSEKPEFAALDKLESVASPDRDLSTTERRISFHGASARFWSPGDQPYGVRCRVLGGASQVWAGKSATFDPIVFSPRPWAPDAHWPFSYESLEPYVDRAAAVLNLGPNCYDDELWSLLGRKPQPEIDRSRIGSFFWQFARSRINKLDVMRFGTEFRNLPIENVQVALNATVIEIVTNPEGSRFQSLTIASIDGARRTVRSRLCVLAGGAIENARLLLASRKYSHKGVGNARDQVGRYLMDHPGARLGSFQPPHLEFATSCFGFCGVRSGHRSFMYMHGLALSPETQKKEGLLNSALYMLEQRAPDDPWDALKRLLKTESPSSAKDMIAVAKGMGFLVKGGAMRVFESRLFPPSLKEAIVNFMISHNPNYVAREYYSSGLPHKLTSVSIDGITEQRPDPDNRVELSDELDAFGVPRARVTWRVGEQERLSLLRIAEIMSEELVRAGLPAPELESWVVERRLQDAVLIDMCHSSGTTRMSDDPSQGVVDADGKVHDVSGLYVAGSSVFPSIGHSNPTLSALAISIRLADHLKGLATKA